MFVKLRSAQQDNTSLWLDVDQVVSMVRRDDTKGSIIQLEDPYTQLFLRDGVGHRVWDTPEKIMELWEEKWKEAEALL